MRGENRSCIYLVVCLIVLLCSLHPVSKACAVELDTIRFHFATIEEARVLMVQEDEYIRHWSKFDIAARLRDPKGTKEELVKLGVAGLREWTMEEKDSLLRIMYKLNRIIRQEKYRLPLPERVTLVKSTIEDEGFAAGYTRAGWIALTDRLFTHLPAGYQESLVAHEIFHVLTRNNSEFKRRMYETISFCIVEGGLEYPEDLLEKRVSNPDITGYDSYAVFLVNGKPEKCAMILYTNRPYTSGSIFEYAHVGFVPYDGHWRPKRINGDVVIYSMDDIQDFFEKVGRNTDYTQHAEEILAENFVLAFFDTPNVKTPELKEKIRRILRDVSL